MTRRHLPASADPTSVSRETTRRVALAAVASGLTGCLRAGSSSPTASATASETPTASDSPTRPQTASEEPDTTVATADERVQTTPPGSPPLAASGEWPGYRFDARNTGFDPAGVGLRAGEQAWRLDGGGPAAISDGQLVNVRDRGEARLTYRDPATAAVEQRAGLVDYGINTPPTLTASRVYLTTFVELFCFDRSGQRLWRGPAMDGIQSRPTVADGRVFVNTGGFDEVEPHLRAFDAADGRPLWRYDTDGDSEATPAVADGTVFVTTTERLHAVDAATGRAVYAVDVPVGKWTTPVVAGDAVAVAGDDRLTVVSASDGAVRWQTPVSTDEPPVVADGEVYAHTDTGLTALDAADGSRQTEFDRAGTPVAAHGSVLYAHRDGQLFAFDRASGQSLWQLRTESVQIADTVGRRIYHVTPADEAVYVAARDAFYGIGSADG